MAAAPGPEANAANSADATAEPPATEAEAPAASVNEGAMEPEAETPLVPEPVAEAPVVSAEGAPGTNDDAPEGPPVECERDQ